MPTTGAYFNTPADLNPGDWALVPTLFKEHEDPMTASMELVLVMSKKGDAVLYIDASGDVTFTGIPALFPECCDQDHHHTRVLPQRPMKDAALAEANTTVRARLALFADDGSSPYRQAANEVLDILHERDLAQLR